MNIVPVKSRSWTTSENSILADTQQRHQSWKAKATTNREEEGGKAEGVTEVEGAAEAGGGDGAGDGVEGAGVTVKAAGEL